MKIPSPAAVIIARRANDTSRSAVERAVDYCTLGSMAEAGQVFIEVPDEFILANNRLPDEDKPKYVWKNGARIKVK